MSQQPWVLDALRADPYVAQRLRLVDGWEVRGRYRAADGSTASMPAPGMVPQYFEPRGVLEHHTACGAPAGHTGVGHLGSIRDGRPGLPGPISQLLVAVDPEGTGPLVYLVACGRANHGNGSPDNVADCPLDPKGGKDWNGSLWGIEVCGPFDLWSDDLIELRARVTGCLLHAMGVTEANVYTHHVANPRNKIDPSGAWRGEPTIGRSTPWNVDAWRYQVAAIMAGQFPPAPPPPPPPAAYPLEHKVTAAEAAKGWWEVYRSTHTSNPTVAKVQPLIDANPGHKLTEGTYVNIPGELP